jgi:hypothetical protein
MHKIGYKKGRRHDYDIYKENRPITPKEILNVFDLRYLDMKKDFPSQIYHSYRKERRQVWNFHKKK